MSVSHDAARRKLYDWIASDVGEVDAEVIMQAIPSTSWDELATRDHLDARIADVNLRIGELRREFTAEISELRTETAGQFAELRSEFTAEISELRTETTGQFAELRSEFTGAIAELRTETAGQFAELRSEFTGAIAELRTETAGQFAELRAELTGAIGELRTETAGAIGELRSESRGSVADLRIELKSEMHTGFARVDAAMRSQLMWMIGTMVALWATTMGAMIALFTTLH